MKLKTSWSFTLFFLALSVCAFGTSKFSEKDATRIGTDAYVFGYPAVVMEMTQEASGPANRLDHMRSFPTPNFKTVVSPNVDTLYSTAWLDLSKEPQILHLPDFGDRFFLMPMLDAWTNVFSDPGTRVGSKMGDYAIVGPNWMGKLPKGVRAIRAPTNAVWLLGSIYSDGTPKDIRKVNELQDLMSLTPLSRYGSLYKAPALAKISEIAPGASPQDQTYSMDATQFFSRLAKIMKANPPSADEAPMLDKLASIGVIPGQEFDPTKLDRHVMRGLDKAVTAAKKKIASVGPALLKSVNGWLFSTRLGNYGIDYMLRAYTALVGLGANLAKDAVYPFAQLDGAGKPLNGSNNYVLHYEPDEIPPVNGFWSVTLYDEHHHFAANPIRRFAIRSESKLALNADGSLDIYIQSTTPGKDKESNWLPSPDNAPFNVILRMYWPEEEVVSGDWRPPPLEHIQTRLAAEK